MILAIDFDNTLAYGEYPACGTPNTRLIEWLKTRKKEGDRLILWTCREGQPLKDAVEWCTGQGLTFDAVNENLPEVKEKYGTDPRKIGCDYYIDDQHFTSDFLIKKTEKHETRRKARII